MGARAEVDSEIEATDWMMDEDDDDSIPPKGENQSSSSIQSVQSESESAREAAAAPPHPPEPPAPERLSASPSEPPAERHAERPALPPPLDALYRDPENWTDAEIDAALCKAAGRDIRNPLPYVRKTLCSARAERADRQQAMTLLAAVPGGTTGAVAIPPARLPARRTLQDMQADHLAFIQQMRADGMLP